MISTSLDFSFRRATARCFSAFLIALLSGCDGHSETKTAVDAAPTWPPGARVAPAGHSGSLQVSVDLSAVRGNVPESSKVFVFVREAGQRMPIGVQQYTVRSVPERISFTANKPYAAVEVVARVSATGKVERSPQDYEALAVTQFGASPVPVVLKPGAEAGTVKQSPVARTQANPVMQPGAATAAAREVSVQISARIPPEVAAGLAPDSTVFIVAKVPGQVLPLAVKRITYDRLPTTIALNDSDSMLPGNSLRSAGALQISARISKSGEASHRSGDWQGFAAAQRGSASFAVVIDTLIP